MESFKKSEAIKTYLTDAGISKVRITGLGSPVGLDIIAKLASEVGIRILAEVIADFRNEESSSVPCCDNPERSQTETKTEVNDQIAEDYYINPVCNVPVSRKNPKHSVAYKREKVYFCCDGCKVSFKNDQASI